MEESTTYQSILRKGRQKGLVEGRQEDVLSLLNQKFGVIPQPVELQVRSATDPDRLKNALLQIGNLQTIDDFKI